MAVFIMAPEADVHAARVEWGLKHGGFEVIRWGGLGWQREHSASIRLGWENGVYLADRRIGPEDTVWLRRPSTTRHPDVDESEQKFAAAEYTAFQRTLLSHIEWTGAFCINKWSAIRLIDNKSIQLTLAEQCGLRAPATTMTNGSRFAREFLDRADADVVHKAFLPHAWFQEQSGAIYLCETTRLDRDSSSLPDETFAYAPGIYQQRIGKGYDVRIHLLDKEFHAFAIRTPKAVLDWRSDSITGGVSLERVTLPVDIEAGLRRFADKADIVFGCIDMVVDTNGEWWFLEINQAGQFLWIDELLPGDGLYQPMLRLLSSREAPTGAEFPTYQQCIAENIGKSDFVPSRDESPFISLEQPPTVGLNS